jgi:hypothetical protein
MKTHCPECDGTGHVDCCISEWTVPKSHKSSDALLELKEDAMKCIADHAKLVTMNPKAEESYDAQLRTTLAKLNKFAENLA